MLINKLKSIIFVAVCCIVSASWSEAQCSESEAESKLNNPFSTLNHFNPTRITNSHDLSSSRKTLSGAQKQKLPAPVETKEKTRQGYFPSTKVIRYIACAAVGLGITYWFYPELFTPDFLTVVGTGTVTAITASNGRPSSIPSTTLNLQDFANYSLPINPSFLDDRDSPPSNKILDYTANIDPLYKLSGATVLRNRLTRTSGIVSLSEENINPEELADITPKVLNVVSMRDFILENTQEYETEKYTTKESKDKEKTCDEKITEKFEKILEELNKKNTEKEGSKGEYCPTLTKAMAFVSGIVKYYTETEKTITFSKKVWNLKNEWLQHPKYKYQLIPKGSPHLDKTGELYYQKFLINRNYSRIWNSIEYYKEKCCKEKKKKEKELLLELEHVRFHHNTLDCYSYQLVKIFASYKGERQCVEGCDLYLMLEEHLPNTLESRHAPAIIRLKDDYELIIENRNSVERIAIPNGMSTDSFEALFRDNSGAGKVFMMWDNPIMQDIRSKGGHTLKHYKIQCIRHKHRKVPGEQENSKKLQIYIEPGELIQIPMKNFPTDKEILVEDLNYKLEWHHDDITHRSIRKHIIPSYSTQGEKYLNDLYDDNEWVPHNHQISHYFRGRIGNPIMCSRGFPIRQLCQFAIKGEYIRPDQSIFRDAKSYDDKLEELDLNLTHYRFKYHEKKEQCYQRANMYVHYNNLKFIGRYTIKKHPLSYTKIIINWNDDIRNPNNNKRENFSIGDYNQVLVDANEALIAVPQEACLLIDISEKKEKQNHERLPFYRWDNWLIPHNGEKY